MTASAVEWKVLYASRPRPLLVPAGNSRQALAAIDFFVANRALRWWGRLMLVLDDLLPSSRLLPSARSERFPIDSLFGEGARFETCFAVHCGSPGPFRKLTIFCPGTDGQQDGEISKVASQPSADQSVCREVHWLKTLGALPGLARFLPRLLRHGTLPCGRRYMTMSVLPSGVHSSQFGEPHFRFLQALAARTRGSAHWRESEPFRRLADRVKSISGLINPQYRALFSAILEEIEGSIGKQALPVCLVHGDFAAWNVRVAGDELLVFDWEYADAGGNPLQDYLHFHLVARATQHRSISSAYTRDLMDLARAYADRTFGAASGVAEAMPSLTLHYLLDTVSFYTDASRFLDVRDPVVRAYLRLLEQREHWLPDRPPEGQAEHVRQ